MGAERGRQGGMGGKAGGVVRWGAALAALLWAAGCATLSEDEKFLVQLDDPVKARVVAEEGVALYQLALVKRGQYERVDEVRRYFEVALRFDPANRQAQAYLELVDKYRQTETRKRLREAEALLKKPRRSQEEDYALCVAATRAGQLAPQDEEVAALLGQTEELRGALVIFYLERGRQARSQARAEAGAEARERLYLEAFRSFNRVLAVEPQNPGARAEQEDLAAAVGEILRERLETGRQLEAKGRFAEARKEAALLEELNRRLGHPLDAEVADLTYRLNYHWARSLFAKRDYPAALARADAALAARKTEEAAALRRRILEARKQSASGLSFEAALGEVDQLAAAGDLDGAWRRIEELASATKDRGRLGALEARREKLRSQLPALYEKAVGYYRADEFQKAAELLETVVVIDVEYQQAAEYLDKARAKQKLLEQFGGEG